MVNSPPNLLTRTENSKDFARQGHFGKMSDRVLWGENLEVEAVQKDLVSYVEQSIVWDADKALNLPRQTSLRKNVISLGHSSGVEFLQTLTVYNTHPL